MLLPLTSEVSSTAPLSRRDSKVPRGREGEELVARFLIEQNFKIESRNLRTPYGEIDITASRGDVFYIFEVKRRVGPQGDVLRREPLKALSPAQLARLGRAAKYLWLQNRGRFSSFSSALLIVTDRGISWTNLPLLYDTA